MAIITKVAAQKRPGRYNIFLDEQYAFSVSEKTLAEYVLLKGKSLTQEQIEEIRQYDADSKASDLAARYLSYEPRTIFEVMQYLIKREVSPESANNAINELSELGYLDDERYCELFIKNDLAVGNDGPRVLNKKLAGKGVAPEIIDQALAEVDQADWLQVAVRLLKSMRQQLGRYSERELKQKINNKLLSHGFSTNLTEDVIQELDLGMDDEKQLEALKMQGIKAYKRFKRYTGADRAMRIKRYLFSHGFSSSEIDLFLNGELIDLDELDEY